jgi:beta-galactosidase
MQEHHLRAPVSRRVFLRTAAAAAAGAAGVAGWSILSVFRASVATTGERGAVAQRGPAYRTVSFNSGWLFGSFAEGSDQPDFDDSQFATVTLPHTVTPLSWQNWNPATWERVWSYRKHFDAPRGLDGLRVFLDFDAAITGSTLTLNGTRVGTHTGGYLPLRAEITGWLRPEGNVLAVTLDSTFNLAVPPDRPAPYISADIDYWQPGGIYRDVSLRAVPQVFIADLFARPTGVLDPASRQVSVRATVDAALVPSGAATLTVELRDPDNSNRLIRQASVPVTITAAGRSTVTATLDGLPDITLWDTENPKLYTVVATLNVSGEPLHDYQVRIGFREAVFRLDGFYLNGIRTKLFGVNRHQFFPYAGGAQPDRVQARDAYILRRELNCNAVRCSHYPQSEAFYDAADELGLMVWEEIPGWGYFGDAAWQEAAYADVGSMIVRDRNHPCVVIWGAMPNEAGEHVAEYTRYKELAHATDPSRPTGGDGYRTRADFVFDVFSIHDYSSLTNAQGVRWPTLEPPADAAGKPYLVCEAVGTLSGPATHFRRTDTQFIQQGEAIAHAIVHDISYSQDAYCGLLAWSGFDYPSASRHGFHGVKYTGVVDLFRVLKPGACIYQAQTDPARKPVIAPAFYWDFNPRSPVTSLPLAMIASNLDELRVYVAGDLFATVTPDTTGYGSLPYPPSFVDFSGLDGSALPELRIDGYRRGAKVATRLFDADPAHDRLELTADDAVIDADGCDATRVVFRAVDRYGNARPYVGDLVTLELDGAAVLVSDNPVDFGATGGVAAAWIRSLPASPGTVTVRASHPALGTAQVTIEIQQIPGDPSPSPHATLTYQRTDVRLARHLRQGQDFVAVLRDEDRVLELSGALAVLRHRRPAVRPDVVIDRAQGEHRLDRERHPRLDDGVAVRVVVVRHDQAGVERRPDSVPGEVPHDAVVEPLGVGLDDAADDVEPPAGPHRLDPAHHRLVRALDQQPGLLVHLARQERGVRVTVHAADEPGDVDVDDVALPHDRVVRDAVADDLIQRGAQRLGVAPVTECRGVRAAGDEEVVTDFVKVVRRDPRLHVAAHFGEGLRRDLPGRPHAFDRVRVLDIGLAERRELLAHVLGALDASGNLPGGRQTTRVEQSGHVLRV